MRKTWSNVYDFKKRTCWLLAFLVGGESIKPPRGLSMAKAFSGLFAEEPKNPLSSSEPPNNPELEGVVFFVCPKEGPESGEPNRPTGSSPNSPTDLGCAVYTR